MKLKHIGHIVFIPSLIYALAFPSFEVSLLMLIVLAFHAHESYMAYKHDLGANEKGTESESLQVAIAEIKDDVTKIKMAHGFKR